MGDGGLRIGSIKGRRARLLDGRETHDWQVQSMRQKALDTDNGQFMSPPALSRYTHEAVPRRISLVGNGPRRDPCAALMAHVVPPPQLANIYQHLSQADTQLTHNST